MSPRAIDPGRAGARLAFATCAEYADLDPDDRLLIEPLAAAGIEVVPAVWNDDRFDWHAVDAVLLRSTWDYPLAVGRFLAWAAARPILFNPLEFVRWNLDKRYLLELEQVGVPIVPTRFAGPGEAVAIPTEWREIVVKPSVSAGSRDTARYARDDPEAGRQIERIGASGRTAMIQPYLAGVESAGETSLIYVDGAFSHAIRKGPLLQPGGVMTDQLFAPEEISPRQPAPIELALGAAVITAVRGRLGTPLYCRVDLLPGPALVEVELIEPSLFLVHGPGSADRVASAVARAVTAALAERRR